MECRDVAFYSGEGPHKNKLYRIIYKLKSDNLGWFSLLVMSFKCTSVNPKTEKCLSSRIGIDCAGWGKSRLIVVSMQNRVYSCVITY